jgi:hypothetical protein
VAAELLQHVSAIKGLQDVSLDVHTPGRAADGQGEETFAAALAALPALTRLCVSGTAFEVPRADAFWRAVCAVGLPLLHRLSLGTSQEHTRPSSVQALGAALARATQLTQLSLGATNKGVQSALAPYLEQLPLRAAPALDPSHYLLSQLAGLTRVDLRVVRAILTCGPMSRLPDLAHHSRLASLCLEHVPGLYRSGR